MIIDEIALLRKKLEQQVIDKSSYDQIYQTSMQIDKLLIKYYKQHGLVKKT